MSKTDLGWKGEHLHHNRGEEQKCVGKMKKEHAPKDQGMSVKVRGKWSGDGILVGDRF